MTPVILRYVGYSYSGVCLDLERKYLHREVEFSDSVPSLKIHYFLATLEKVIENEDTDYLTVLCRELYKKLKNRH